MPMVTVSISPMQVAGIRAAVDNGNYASGSEVVREALRLWDAARKCGPPDTGTDLHDKNSSDGKRVADMFAEYDASTRAHN